MTGQQLKRHPFSQWPSLVLLAIVLMCITGPWISPYSFDGQNLNLGKSPPSLKHWLGTDILGRDLLTRTLHAGRVSILVGLVATAISLLLGVSAGLVSGYFRGWIDAVLMRFVEGIYALPFTVIVILLMVAFSDVQGLDPLVIVFVGIGCVEWLTMARVIRGTALGIRSQPFVDAAIQLGQSHLGVIRKHLLPNVSGTIIVYATLTIPGVMLLEAFLSFLGLGVQPPRSSWGMLIREGSQIMEVAPWLLAGPVAFFSITLLALNRLGDQLRDHYDPKTAS